MKIIRLLLMPALCALSCLLASARAIDPQHVFDDPAKYERKSVELELFVGKRYNETTKETRFENSEIQEGHSYVPAKGKETYVVILAQPLYEGKKVKEILLAIPKRDYEKFRELYWANTSFTEPGGGQARIFRGKLIRAEPVKINTPNGVKTGFVANRI